jgi:hypothetical protein
LALTITGLSKTYPNGVKALKTLRDRRQLHVYSESNPGEAFVPVPSGLEDVYFLNLARHANN